MLRADFGGFADSGRYGLRQVASFGTSDNGPLSRRGFLFRLRRTKNLPSLPLLHNKHYVNLPEAFYALQLSPPTCHLPALPEKGFLIILYSPPAQPYGLAETGIK